MTTGMIFTVTGDKPRMEYDLKKGDPSGVTFDHKNPMKLSDEELLSLTQLNFKPPPKLMAEIARRGLQSKFRDLWQRGEL